MSRTVDLPDLVRDTRLEAELRGDITTHRHRAADDTAHRRLRTHRVQWQREKEIGKGGFGRVFLERRKGSCPAGQADVRAVKRIRPAKHTDYIHELEAIAKFSHVNYQHCFVKSYGWYEHLNSLYIAMEYLSLGDLHRYVTTQQPLAEEDVRAITCQVLEGVAFMHDNSFVHRDIKPKNILVRQQPPDPWWVKLADFGISKRFADDSRTNTGVKGSLDFMAPEFFSSSSRRSTAQVRPDPYAADMWAVGCTSYYLFTNSTPFDGDIGALVGYCFGHIPYPGLKSSRMTVTDLAVDLVSKLLHASPSDRPCASAALRHSWVKDLFLESCERIDTRTSDIEDPISELAVHKPASVSAASSVVAVADDDKYFRTTSQYTASARWTTLAERTDDSARIDEKTVVTPNIEARQDARVGPTVLLRERPTNMSPLSDQEVKPWPPAPSVEDIAEEDGNAVQSPRSGAILEAVTKGLETSLPRTDDAPKNLGSKSINLDPTPMTGHAEDASVDDSSNNDENEDNHGDGANTIARKDPWWWEMPVLLYKSGIAAKQRIESPNFVSDCQTNNQTGKSVDALSSPQSTERTSHVTARLSSVPKRYRDHPLGIISVRSIEDHDSDSGVDKEGNQLTRSQPLRPLGWTWQPYHPKRVTETHHPNRHDISKNDGLSSAKKQTEEQSEPLTPRRKKTVRFDIHYDSIGNDSYDGDDEEHNAGLNGQRQQNSPEPFNTVRSRPRFTTYSSSRDPALKEPVYDTRVRVDQTGLSEQTEIRRKRAMTDAQDSHGGGPSAQKLGGSNAGDRTSAERRYRSKSETSVRENPDTWSMAAVVGGHMREYKESTAPTFDVPHFKVRASPALVRTLRDIEDVLKTNHVNYVPALHPRGGFQHGFTCRLGDWNTERNAVAFQVIVKQKYSGSSLYRADIKGLQGDISKCRHIFIAIGRIVPTFVFR